MNAPVGDVLQPVDIERSLCNGRLSARSEDANAVLGYLFVEIEPRVIATCAVEAGCSIVHANQLYLNTLAHLSPRSPQWEATVEGLL